MLNIFNLLLVFVSFSTLSSASHWDPSDDEPVDLDNCQDSHEDPVEIGSIIRTQRYQINTFEIFKTEPQLGPFTDNDILSDFPQGGRFLKVTWYVEDEKFLELRNFQIENGVIVKGEISFGALDISSTVLAKRDKICPLEVINDKENEKPF